MQKFFFTLRSGKGLNSPNKNNRANFSGEVQSWSFLRCLFSSENSRKATLNNIIHVLKSVVNTVSKYANLATELGRQLTKGKRAERTKHNLSNLSLCYWSSQLFDLRASLRSQLTFPFRC